MVLDDIDFEADASASATRNVEGAARIARLATRLAELSETQARLTAELEAVDRERREIATRHLPEEMGGLGLMMFPLSPDLQVVVSDVIAASVPKSDAVRYDRMLGYLRDRGHGDIIKTQIVIPLSRGQDNVGGAILEYVRKEYGVEGERESVVPPPTLGKWVREMIAKAGEDPEAERIPEDVFGVFRGRVAELKAPPKTKAKTKARSK